MEKKGNFQSFSENLLKSSSIHCNFIFVSTFKIRKVRKIKFIIYLFLLFFYDRFFWILSLTFVSCVSFFLAYESILKFISDQTVIKISKHAHPIDGIPFPSLTICLDPTTFLLRSKASNATSRKHQRRSVSYSS